MKGEDRFVGMFKGKERIKLKIEEIRQSPELLRINSRYISGGGALKIALILVIALLLIFYKDIINIIKDKAPDQQLVLATMIVLFFAVLLFAIYRMNLINGKALIITEKGFFIEPLLVELWKNINEYKWNASSGTNKDMLTGQSEGISLLLYNNKGSWPQIYNLMSYSIYFTPDQVQQMDYICERLGIKKIED